jgi:hypothetical protein
MVSSSPKGGPARLAAPLPSSCVGDKLAMVNTNDQRAKKMLKKNIQSSANPFSNLFSNLDQSFLVLPPQLLTNLFYRQKTAWLCCLL